jgi:hypothetical protein
MYYRDLPQYIEEMRGKLARDYNAIAEETELFNFTRSIVVDHRVLEMQYILGIV